MKHWRHSNPNHPTSHSQHVKGVELTLQELLECKRLSDTLQLPTQQKVKTHLLGGFISHFKGRGMDFDEARAYQMGDDIRSIDWRVTARTGEAHTKIYREERERPVFVILDQSAGMMFGTRQQFKSIQAAKLASLIMWKTLDDGNRFGAMIFDENHHFEYKPANSRKSCLRVLNKMVENHNAQIQRHYYQSQKYQSQTYQSQKPSTSKSQQTLEQPKANTFSETLYRARRLIKPGSLVFVLSDFQEFQQDAEHHLLRLAQHNDVNVCHVFDPIENELPPPDRYTITNGKKRLTINTASTTTRQAFKQTFNNKVQQLVTLCNKHRMRWSQLSTDENLTRLFSPTNATSDSAKAATR